MSTLSIKQTEESPKYAENILPICANFNDIFTWNIASGGANGIVVNTNQKKYAGERALRVSFTGTGEIVFNRGNSDFELPILTAGFYILSYRVLKTGADSIMNLKVNVYINGVLYPDYIIEQTLDSADGLDDIWVAYTQIIYVDGASVLDFGFSAQSNATSSQLYIDGMSLMYDDRQLGMLPVYREVEETITTINVTETIDVPSIASNSSHTVVMTVTGAVVGDFISGFTYPIELITLDLVVGQPLVTDVDEVSFIIHNHTGGALNPASGNYTIKIVK
jgi:hypothetical protein